MHEPWFYCPALHPGDLTLDYSEARHALGSVRLRPGDRLTLFDGAGHIAHATVLANRGERRAKPAAGQRVASVRVESVESSPAPGSQLTLIVAGCKGPRLDWLVEKCTELGVLRMVFAEFERSVVHVGPRHVEKLRRTAIEACKQCRRAYLPEIQASLSLGEAIAAKPGTALLAAHPDRTAPSLGTWLAAHRSVAHSTTVVIGPEGGLSPGEVAALASAGSEFVRLAEHILRVETAAVAVSAHWAAGLVPH